MMRGVSSLGTKIKAFQRDPRTGFERKHTPRKVMNLLLTRLSYAMRMPKVLGFPYSLMIEPTNICNLKCPLCPTGQGLVRRPKGQMSLEGFKSIIDEVGEFLYDVSLFFYGESLLNKDIFSMISYAEGKGVSTALSTNASFLDRERTARLIASHLTYLIVCLDGASQETYQRYRVGGNFQEIVSNIALLSSEKKRLMRKTPFVELQFIVMRHNEHEIEDIEKLSRDLGVDRLFLKTMGSTDVFHEMAKEEFLPTVRDFQRDIYQEEGRGLLLNKAPCPRPWTSAIISWDGYVYPCCYDAQGDFTMGNVFEEGFKKVWRGERYSAFRRALLEGQEKISLCRGCPKSGR